MPVYEPSGDASLREGSSGNSGIAADTFAAAGDGLANIVKYALGLDPRVPAAPGEAPVAEATNGILSITFRRARDAAGVTLRVEGASDLTNGWTEEIWSSATNAYGGGTNAFEVISVADPLPMDQAPSGQRYLRLKVTRP